MKNKILKKTLIGLVAVALSFVAVGIVFIAIQIVKAPNLSEVDASPEGYLSTILDRDGEVVNTLYVTESNRIYVGLDNIPKELQEAFIAIEDSRFYDHHGIDLQGIARAFTHGITTGSFNQGASTITQQLLKNNVFIDWMSEENFYDRLCRKVQEQFLAIRLEQKYSKEWILENYLNTINLGGGTRGVQVAAQYYFGKDVSELSLAECALIAGITKNPTTYNPLLNPEKSLDRQTLVLDALLKQEYISQEEYEQAVLEDVIGALQKDSKNRGVETFSWFEDALLQQIVKDLTATYRYYEEEAWNLIYSGGLTISSTMDTKLQELCELQATNPEWYADNEEVSIVMTEVSSGEVLAIVGSSQKKTESLVYNRATDAVRQPGSTIKVIGEYAAVLDSKGVTLGTVIADEPYAYSNGTEINNSYGKFYGMTTIRDAIKTSSNVVALKAYQMAGERLVFDYLQRFGISTLTEEDKNEAIAIGGTYNGVTNLEMTAAYNAIANSGRYIQPHFYTKITDRNGNVILENKGDYEQVIKKETAQLLTSAMQDVISDGTGTGAAVSGLELAGKSGTTNEKRDAWFVGYSSYYTCGIWGGYDDNSTQSSTAYVKKIWKKIMTEAHTGKENVALVNDENLMTAVICTKCGNLAVEGMCEDTVQGNMSRKEYFTATTVPTKDCDCHVTVTLCEDSGLKAGTFCSKLEKTYLKDAIEGTVDCEYVLPENAEETCEEHKYFWDPWFDEGQPKEEHEEDAPEEPEEQEEHWWDRDMFHWFF